MGKVILNIALLVLGVGMVAALLGQFLQMQTSLLVVIATAVVFLALTAARRSGRTL